MRKWSTPYSIRTHLAIWHSLVLALVLVSFALATWIFLDRLTSVRIDQSLEEAVSAFYQAVEHELRDGASPEEAASLVAREFRFSERRVLVYGDRHRLLAISDSTHDLLTDAISAIEEADNSPLHPIFASLIPGSSVHATVEDGQRRVRGYARSLAAGGDAMTIVALQLGPSERSIMANFIQAIIVAIPLALLLAGGGGYFLARRSLLPVISMGREAASIDSEHLTNRLPIRGTGDELDELATVFNEMLSRLERSFHNQQQFIADASHELRTPLASLRAAADIAISQQRAANDYKAALVHVRTEARRISAIVEDLFTLARLDVVGPLTGLTQLYLEEQVMTAIDAIRPLATECGVSIAFTPSEEACFNGDPLLLDRVITNLLDNAIKHSPAGGTVSLELVVSKDRYDLHVRDQGVGIPEEARERIFGRFFRIDEARTRGERGRGGAGLGLPIARSIARAHHGDLVLTESNEKGTVFTLWLPRSVA